MKYQYKFGTGYESIEVDEEWMAVLRDLDRLEQNHDARQRYSTRLHYDAFEYVPEFMAKEDEGLSQLFDGSPAFDYAIEHLLPRHQDILFRRAYKGEMFKDIGKTYDVSASAIHHYYTKIVIRFKKFYEEGVWLYSSKNTSTSAGGRVKSIPFGLTPAQVMAIRAYRCQLRSQEEIAELVVVLKSRVERCLRDNPILETVCPACGKPISQIGYGVLQKFCDTKCYMNWFRKYGMDADSELKINNRERITPHQKAILDFYRQNHFTLSQMHIVTGISEQFISSYCYSNPLPYTICIHCGKQIPGEKGKWPSKYCSVSCRSRYHENRKKMQRRNSGNSRYKYYPTLDHLEYALVLREACYSFTQIENLTGMTEKNIADLFRFNKDVVRTCPTCKKPFTTDQIQAVYCSQKCKNKAIVKRRKKRRKEKKKNELSQPSNKGDN